LFESLLLSLAVLLRILSNPFGNVFQKQLTARGNHPLVVNFLTYLILAILSLLLLKSVTFSELPPAFWINSTLVGIAGALGNGFLVKALQRGDLSVLGPINSYKSVVGIIAGIFILGEIPNIWGIAGIVLIIYGSYFVLDTTDDKFSFALLKKNEIQFRIWALILTAIEAVFIKRIINVSSPVIAFISWCVFGAFFSFFLLVIYKLKIREEFSKLTSKNFFTYIYLVGCIGIMQLTTNYAFAKMQVGYALSLFQLSIIVSVLLGYKIFKEQDVRKKLIGSGIMIAGSIIITLLKGN
jgi:drug/metabolite transporter (DMT)-like permease